MSAPVWQLLDRRVIVADCVEAMRSMPAESIDAVVCDPPYGLEFMGKDWDRLGDRRGIVDPDSWGGTGAFSRSTRSPAPARRIGFWLAHPEGVAPEVALVADRDRQRIAETGQLDLLGEEAA